MTAPRNDHSQLKSTLAQTEPSTHDYSDRTMWCALPKTSANDTSPKARSIQEVFGSVTRYKHDQTNQGEFMRLAALTIVAVMAAINPMSAMAQGRPAGVQTAKVENREMTERVTVFGQIVAVRESDVATRVAGVVNQVPIKVGSIVSEGDILILLE